MFNISYRFLLSSILLVFAPFFSLPNGYAENPRIKVGVIVPLTGSVATVGSAIKNGIELARHEHPEILGDLLFVYEDDGYEPKRDITAFNKLMIGQRPAVLLGLGPNLVEVLAARLEGEHLPLINFGFVAAPAIG
jgi:ABC-type branched-subunit amino acid transport system substrate-binding protein